MDNDTEEEEQQAAESGDEEEEGEARPPPVPPPHRTAEADILDPREAMLVQRAMDESLQHWTSSRWIIASSSALRYEPCV